MSDKSLRFESLIERHKKSNASIEFFRRDNNVTIGQLRLARKTDTKFTLKKLVV